MLTEKKGYSPSDRICNLRKHAMDNPGEHQFGWQRSFYYVEGWMANEGQAFSTRAGKAMAHTILNMPLRISNIDLMAGEHGNPFEIINFNRSFGPETEKRIAESDLTSKQKTLLTKWMATDPFKHLGLPAVEQSTPEIRLAEAHGVLTVWGVLLNHSIRDYEKVIRLGFSGIRDEIAAELETLEITDPDAGTRIANLNGWLSICEASMELGKRHAELARKMAAETDCAERRRELLEIAEACDRVPAYPARTFREAVQSLWFAHMITVWEDSVNANGIGRIDQFLWPYLQRELESGMMKPEEAKEILATLWIKLYQPYDVQQMMIGGLHPDGSDAINPLSYLVLDVTEGLEFVRCLSARLHANTPRDFASRCVDLIAKGGGIPFFFNDEALVPALVSKGIPIEEARGYAAIGCIEITIPGKALPHAVSNWINVAKCLELALNDGKDLLDDIQVGPRTGSLDSFKSMDDVLAAFNTQFEYFAKLVVYGSNAFELNHKQTMRMPYLSILTSDCISRGRDVTEGGARYNYHSSAAMGIPNAADSLAALKIAVFDNQLLTPAEMLEALKTNFAGNEELQKTLQFKMPKYGNDEDVPDMYAADLTRIYCETLAKYKTPADGKFFAHLFTFVLMLQYGAMTGASPDGRMSGAPLAYSVSPGQGRDKEGLTAVINSLAKLPHHLAAASSSAILEADPKLLEGSGREIFTDLLMTAIRQGIGQLQFNVVSVDTLKAAKADPDSYRNLCVRVSGFSQQFCLLDSQMQDHIISRTKHAK
jgi:formate C-acetyltransferase